MVSYQKKWRNATWNKLRTLLYKKVRFPIYFKENELYILYYIYLYILTKFYALARKPWRNMGIIVRLYWVRE